MKIWIDLDNTPHVPFFAPIVEELERRGHQVVLTARDAFQVCELADRMGIPYTKIGRHYGKNRILKVAGLLWRATQLLPFYLREKPDIALSHGSRAQVLLCNTLRVPTILSTDYEFARIIPLTWPKWVILPQALSDTALARKLKRVRYYRGLKEDVYAPLLKLDRSVLDELGLNEAETIVVVRPPANEAHYHNPESDVLLDELMARLTRDGAVRVVLLPRNEHQARSLRENHADWFADGKTVVPARAVDGLNLLWFSDLVVSGGGTMNREAAALGIPVYSIFCGHMGAIDRSLEQDGRLTMVRTAEEVRTKVTVERRTRPPQPDRTPRPALVDIVGHVEEIMRAERAGPR